MQGAQVIPWAELRKLQRMAEEGKLTRTSGEKEAELARWRKQAAEAAKEVNNDGGEAHA